MLSTKDHLRHLIDCLSDGEAEALLNAADKLGLLGNVYLATQALSCPSCGERRFECLRWTADGCLVCGSCATTYDPNAPGALHD